MRKLRCCIIDDEPLALELIKSPDFVIAYPKTLH